MTRRSGARRGPLEPIQRKVANVGASRRLVAAHLDPEVELLTCAFEDGEVVRLPSARLKLPPGAPIVYAAVDRFSAGIEFVREDGTRTDCGADIIQYLVDPAYRTHHSGDADSEEDFARRVGTRLVALRQELGLSQRDFAVRIGMAAPNYARLEAGRHVPSVPTLLRLAEVLGRPLAELISRD